MNKPILTFFALFLSITAVAQEEPSKEDTIAWLYEKTHQIEISKFDNPGTKYEYRKRDKTISIDFPEDGTTIEISLNRDWTDYKFHDGELNYTASTHTIRAKLSDLSAHVELEETDHFPIKEYIDIVLLCSSKDCFKGEQQHVYSGGDGWQNFSVSWGRATITIPRTIADRVQKALSHLITLSGGKEAVSEDLF